MRRFRQEGGANITERRAAKEAIGHSAHTTAAGSLPRPDWDSGNVPLAPLPPGSPPQWHTLRHGLGSTNLLVDAKLGGTNAHGQVVWSLTTETLFALTGPNALRFRWDLDEDVWDRYKEQLGITGGPRLRVWMWRW
ncbi:MAG TPA: hypothetical protein VHF70_00520 [Rubrobacteraceae bacterium]|nr:hypothetical protein [Rubrobacteraceae bacterium]